mmetsp:Transcript_78576/g.163261  ORF Transcript_78576/g.163261 Transcript_78576/m.163261 type:complete len:1092 (+) Transcript_78576:156-3431(+)|eukprot:CAMPEP_0206432662 /NCGR_PEP_ID=MMETSP0324_2-20121206/8091_1 /ASSEMBLY_ACC=CAM_ASM_000836 /TAXON_ID=2866 /ORGANISM="Crypthecodinium cohnii, Strain Seligo" /LENGTH=1091 /DNA_ID=CAMNT_0053898819 /DNA_START=159 /DNA_END=3434 /DNA_ORIENTATION=-
MPAVYKASSRALMAEETESVCLVDEESIVQDPYIDPWVKAKRRSLMLISAIALVVGTLSLVQRQTSIASSTRTSTEVVERDSAEALRLLQGPLSESVVFTTPKNVQVSVGVAGGSCIVQKGPLSNSLPKSDNNEVGAGFLVFDAELPHIVCVPGKMVDDKEWTNESPFHVVAGPGFTSRDGGEYGYGPGIAVGVRPDVATTATWQLQARVRSLGLLIPKDKPYRLMGLHVEKNGVGEDLPLVVLRRGTPEQPISMEFATFGQGSCDYESASDTPLIACRASESAVGKLTQLLVFCSSCEEGEAAVTVSSSNNALVDQVKVGAREPWVPILTDAPALGTIEYWNVAVQLVGQKDPTVVKVAMVSGPTRVPITRKFRHREFVAAAGQALGGITQLVLGVFVASVALMAWRLPGATMGLVPIANIVISVCQFTQEMALAKKAPVQFSVLLEPSMMFPWPSDPTQQLLVCLGGLVIVSGFHVFAVMQHLARNGSGAAESLPHHLRFGSWELRALPFLTIPISSAAMTLLRRGYSAHAFEEEIGFLPPNSNPVPDMILGSTVLLGMTALPVFIITKLRTVFNDESVIRVEMPNTEETIFVDRVSDQLRAMPASAGLSCLTSWSSAPGWMIAPPMCSIAEMEHQGLPGRAFVAGSSEAVWPSGPWGFVAKPVLNQSFTAEFDRNGSKGALSRSSQSYLRIGSMNAADEAGMRYADSLSPLAAAHNIGSTVLFPFKATDKLTVAGILSLPWLDVAVPASALRLLWASLGEGDFNLDVHVGQLSGPITSGRLAACFDWFVRSPYHWSLDMLGKVLLGSYLGAWPYLASDSLTYMMTVEVAAFLALLIVLALAIWFRPYASRVDNTMLALGLSAIAVNMGGSVFYNYVGPKADTLGVTTMFCALVFVLLAVLLMGSAMLMMFALSFQGQNQDEVLIRTVNKWGRDAKTMERQPSIVKVWPIQDGKALEILPLELPAWTTTRPMQVQIKLPAPPAGVKGVVVEGERPVMALPTDLLLLPPNPQNYDRKSAKPSGAVFTKHGAVVLYRDAERNHGKNWEKLVSECIGARREDVSKEIVRALKEQGKRYGEQTFVAVEVAGPL